MTPDEIAAVVGKTGFMTLERGRIVTRFLQEHGLKDALELGFAHGVSTCYIAAAVTAGGGGSLVSIDLESARSRTPNAEDLLSKCGSRDRVTLYYEPTSYTWRLMKLLEEDPSPRFDFCYIDGAHSWFEDGFAFFLVDRLLREGGWVLFDDLYWTFATSPTLGNTALVKAMPPDERTTPQVGRVFDLLVKTHPSYGEFRIQDGWGYARKIDSGSHLPGQGLRS